MLPPVGSTLFDMPVGPPTVANVGAEPVANQFADNMLAHRQEVTVASSASRDVHHTAQRSAQREVSLDASAVAEEPLAVALPPMSGDTAPTAVQHNLALDQPGASVDQLVPVVLPPTGNLLPLAALEHDAEAGATSPTLQLPLERLSQFDSAVGNIQADVFGNGLTESLSKIAINVPSNVAGAEAGERAAAITQAGLAAASAAALVAAGSENNRDTSHRGITAKPGSEVPPTATRVPTTALYQAISSTSEAVTPQLQSLQSLQSLQPALQTMSAALTSYEAKSQVTPSPLAATGSLLASTDPAAAPGRVASGLPALPAMGLTPDQLRELNAMGDSNVPSVKAATTKPGAAAAQPVGSNASALSSTLAAATSGEVPNLGSQLAMSTAASALSDRAVRAERSTGNLTAAYGRSHGLTSPAGNRLELPALSETAATLSAQLRGGIAGVEQQQVASLPDTTTANLTGSLAATTESSDAAHLTTSVTAHSRNSIAPTTLPTALMSVPAQGRLDMSDGLNGQWVGRISQMIAQQQLTGQSLRIALSPAELGALELTFSGNADNWSVSLSAQQGQTRELLESHLERIRAMLQDLGHRDAQVSMSGRWSGGETSSGQQNAADPQTAAEQNSGWQHSPAVERTPTNAARAMHPSLGIGRADTPSGVDAYV